MSAPVRTVAASLVLGLGLALAAQAGAHVEVLPARAEVDQAQEFTVRVPVERDLATTAVRVEFPAQVGVYSFRPPPPGFLIQILRRPDGRIRGVVYRGRIPVAAYQSFQFLATPIEPGVALWRAYQTYADGAVKPWTQASEPGGEEAAGETGPTAPGPAAATSVVAVGELAAGEAREEDDGTDAATWLGLIAIAIAVMAALAAGLLWATRPMTLPPDDPE